MVQFQSKGFYYFLCIFLSLILVANALTILAYQSLLPFITIGFIGIVLFSVIAKKSWSKLMVKAWAVLLMISGGAKITATIFRLIDYKFFDGAEALQEIIWSDVIFRTILSILGVVVYTLANKHIKVLNEKESLTETKEAT